MMINCNSARSQWVSSTLCWFWWSKTCLKSPPVGLLVGCFRCFCMSGHPFVWLYQYLSIWCVTFVLHSLLCCSGIQTWLWIFSPVAPLCSWIKTKHGTFCHGMLGAWMPKPNGTILDAKSLNYLPLSLASKRLRGIILTNLIFPNFVQTHQ
jgi:hypothetical protein